MGIAITLKIMKTSLKEVTKKHKATKKNVFLLGVEQFQKDFLEKIVLTLSYFFKITFSLEITYQQLLYKYLFLFKILNYL